MPMDKDSWGAAIAAEVSGLGITAGTPVSPAQLTQVWTAVAKASKEHLETNADVPAAGLMDSLSAPVTGSAKII